ALSRRQKGSRRKQKACLRVTKIYQRFANQRGDFLHKLTKKLVNSYGGICLGDRSDESSARTKLAESFLGASRRELCRQLKYKAAWNRKVVVVVGRYGGVSDGDLAAAVALRDEGIRQLAVGHTESQNAWGRGVRPPTGGNFGRTENPSGPSPLP
ncbi:MAG: transposase, partial [Isosphaeraceae bacterium]|nr:transposase [Isosphaeraceae bacterium]